MKEKEGKTEKKKNEETHECLVSSFAEESEKHRFD